MSGVDKCPTIDVIGGTYKEICLEPVWEQIYGSGLRASLTVCGLDEKCSEIDATIADKQKQLETLDEYKKSLIFEYVTGKKEVS